MQQRITWVTGILNWRPTKVMKSLRQQVLNRLIDEALLDQYSRELKLGISDEQVKRAISPLPLSGGR